jgi:predicted transcriptional regulator
MRYERSGFKMLSSVNQEQILSERYEVAFNLIEEALREIVNYHDKRFTVLVREGAKAHHLIQRYKEDLEQYAKLRNAIVHEKREVGFYIAEPHIEVVEHIEHLAKIFTSPNYALSIATREVVTFLFEDSIEKVIQGIKEYSYSQYPIYRGKECIGLLTAGDVVKWMATHLVSSIVDLRDIKVSDIMSVEGNHPLSFAKKSINIFEVEDIYKSYHKQDMDLEAVIITENGKSDEAPLGLITAWDLIEIDYTAD